MMHIPPKPESENLSGMVERVTFHNEENEFAILRVKVSKPKDLVTIARVLPSISVGEHVNTRGTWKNDDKYGLLK